MLCDVLLEPIIPSRVCKVKHTYEFSQDMDWNLPLGFLELCCHMKNIAQSPSHKPTGVDSSHFGGKSSELWVSVS